MALPVMWQVLDKAGNSHTDERISLMERFLACFTLIPNGEVPVPAKSYVQALQPNRFIFQAPPGKGMTRGYLCFGDGQG
ncbi:MAG: hypothetical protein D6819_08075 [Gammaproteobacteria bacterium]|nr:MAG: hypothetical protein D6819_08075 [Gammaproteobacteria bacterium]